MFSVMCLSEVGYHPTCRLSILTLKFIVPYCWEGQQCTREVYKYSEIGIASSSAVGPPVVVCPVLHLWVMWRLCNGQTAVQGWKNLSWSPKPTAIYRHVHVWCLIPYFYRSEKDLGCTENEKTTTTTTTEWSVGMEQLMNSLSLTLFQLSHIFLLCKYILVSTSFINTLVYSSNVTFPSKFILINYIYHYFHWSQIISVYLFSIHNNLFEYQACTLNK